MVYGVPNLPRRICSVLVRNHAVRGTLLGAMIVGIVYASGGEIPGFQTYGTTVLLFVVLWELCRGRENVEKFEDRFWNDITLAFGSWLAADLVIIPFYPGVVPLAAAVLEELFFGSYFVFLVLAFERRPDMPVLVPQNRVERLLRLPAVAVFVLGMVVYFTLISAIYNPQFYRSGVPSYYLYLILDCFLFVRVAVLAYGTYDPRWKFLYSGFVGYFAVALAGDLESLTSFLGLPIVWKLPLAYAILLAGVRRVRFTEGRNLFPSVPSSDGFDGTITQTLFYVLAFPLLHFLFYTTGSLDDLGKPAREILIIIWLLLLGTVTIIQLFFLQRSRENLGEELASRRRAQIERERYIQTISHDLKNPVTTLGIFLGSLEEDLAKGKLERAHTDYEHIRTASSTLRGVLDELLDKYERGFDDLQEGPLPDE